MGGGVFLLVKKVITIMLIFVMCLSTFSFNNASAEEPVVSEDGNVIFTTLVLTNTYSKVKVEYRDTGLVEYIESVLENGKFVNYVVSSDNERQHKVEAVEMLSMSMVNILEEKFPTMLKQIYQMNMI